MKKRKIENLAPKFPFNFYVLSFKTAKK